MCWAETVASRPRTAHRQPKASTHTMLSTPSVACGLHLSGHLCRTEGTDAGDPPVSSPRAYNCCVLYLSLTYRQVRGVGFISSLCLPASNMCMPPQPRPYNLLAKIPEIQQLACRLPCSLYMPPMLSPSPPPPQLYLFHIEGTVARQEREGRQLQIHHMSSLKLRRFLQDRLRSTRNLTSNRSMCEAFQRCQNSSLEMVLHRGATTLRSLHASAPRSSVRYSQDTCLIPYFMLSASDSSLACGCVGGQTPVMAAVIGFLFAAGRRSRSEGEKGAYGHQIIEGWPRLETWYWFGILIPTADLETKGRGRVSGT